MPTGVNVGVNGRLSLGVSPASGWRRVRGHPASRSMLAGTGFSDDPDKHQQKRMDESKKPSSSPLRVRHRPSLMFTDLHVHDGGWTDGERTVHPPQTRGDSEVHSAKIKIQTVTTVNTFVFRHVTAELTAGSEHARSASP